MEFIVAKGGKLTFNNVIVNDTIPASQLPDTFETYLPVKVEDGGTFTTTGYGVLINNNGSNGDAYHQGYALYLAGGATANLNADTNVKVQGENPIDNGVEEAYGTYASESAVFAEAGSTLNITKGNYISENYDQSTIQSAGRVNIDAASLNDVTISELRLNGGQAVLNAKNLVLSYLQPGKSDLQTGTDNINGTLELHGGAKAYLTDSRVDAISVEGGINTNAVYVDATSKVYEQESELNSVNALSQRKSNSTGYDTPSFSDFKSYYQGDHLTKNQYYVQGVIDSGNAVSEEVTNPNHALGLWKLNDGAESDDLESQVNAAATKLTEGAQDDQDASGSSTLSAYLPLGKSLVYGRYEVSKASPNDADIAGEGHVYAYSVVHELQAGWDVSSYRSGSEYTAPEGDGQTSSGVEGDVAPEGYVFAGWYTKGGDLRAANIADVSPNFTSEVMTGDLISSENPAKPLGQDKTTGYAYAKFVPAGLFNVKGQNHVGDNWSPQYPNAHARFVSALDSYNYDGVDYTITLTKADGTTSEQKVHATTAFDYIMQANKKTHAYDADAYGDVAGNVGTGKQLLFTRAYIDGSLDDVTSVSVSVTVKTSDGTSVTFAPKTFPVKNGQLQSSQNN